MRRHPSPTQAKLKGDGVTLVTWFFYRRGMHFKMPIASYRIRCHRRHPSPWLAPISLGFTLSRGDVVPRGSFRRGGRGRGARSHRRKR
jgi:hypothetical protein